VYCAERDLLLSQNATHGMQDSADASVVRLSKKNTSDHFVKPRSSAVADWPASSAFQKALTACNRYADELAFHIAHVVYL
jgi:hypothetical protein